MGGLFGGLLGFSFVDAVVEGESRGKGKSAQQREVPGSSWGIAAAEAEARAKRDRARL